MRITLFAGKGGAGKTSMAAATGIKTAQPGHRTIVFKINPNPERAGIKKRN